MLGKLSRPVVTATCGLLTAVAVTIGTPAAFGAPRPAVPAAPELPRPGGTNTLPIQVPFDNELAIALKFLKQVGGDKIFVEVLQAIVGAAGQISPLPSTAAAPTPGINTPGINTPGIKQVDAVADPMNLLRHAGVQPLSPSVAPLCLAPTANNPLGIVPAHASAIPGPWPLRTAHPLTHLPFPLPGITVPDPNIVKEKQTAFAFIPADTTVAGKRGTMRVAWFNTANMRGGINDLTPLSDTNPMMKVLPGLSGVRLVPVDTGKGTILAAVYGTAGVNGKRECFFLPSVGVVNS